LLLGLAGCGLMLFKIGGWYFDHRRGTAQSVGAAAVLIGFALMIAVLGAIWVIRVRHLLRW
jgi:hypothetical protein